MNTEVQIDKPNHASTYKASTCIMCTNITLAKTTYTIKSKVRGWEIILCYNEVMAIIQPSTLHLLCVIANLK